MKILKVLPILFVLGCTTHPHSSGRNDYITKIENHSAGDKQFAGLYDNFEFRSTLLTHDITKSINNRMDQFYEWDDQEEKQKLAEQMADLDSKTKIWLSFFTPDRKNDNLANKVSIWKIYLEANGQRYEGHAYKANKNYEEAVSIFPYHSRWATAYYVDFPVPTSEVENSRVKLIITGPLGRREVEFPSLQ